MKYDYELVISAGANLPTAGEADLKRRGQLGFKVKSTWTEQDSNGNTVFIFLMEKEIP
jgi:hypothetical protein